ncbi:unnamed protein product, partial [marine sediment metagenome]
SKLKSYLVSRKERGKRAKRKLKNAELKRKIEN